MKEITSKVKNMELVLSNGQTVLHILVNFITITFTGKEYILGLTEEFMKENGEQIRCMVKARSSGQMVASMSENTVKTKKEDTVNLFGLMVEYTVENG